MPATAETSTLAGAELARWLLSLLREYTGKLNGVCDRAFDLAEIQTNPVVAARLLPHAARFLAMQFSLKRQLLNYTGRASALLDHHHFEDDDLKEELSGRWTEAEEAVRASDTLVSHLTRFLERAGHMKQIDGMTEFIHHGTED